MDDFAPAPDRGGNEQEAKKRKCGFHDYFLRITLNRATSDRTPQYYLAAHSESLGLRQLASGEAAT
jgi:hypothetical protein